MVDVGAFLLIDSSTGEQAMKPVQVVTLASGIFLLVYLEAVLSHLVPVKGNEQLAVISHSIDRVESSDSVTNESVTKDSAKIRFVLASLTSTESVLIVGCNSDTEDAWKTLCTVNWSRISDSSSIPPAKYVVHTAGRYIVGESPIFSGTTR